VAAMTKCCPLGSRSADVKRVLVPSAALLWGLQIAFLSPALALILVTLYHASTPEVGWILTSDTPAPVRLSSPPSGCPRPITQTLAQVTGVCCLRFAASAASHLPGGAMRQTTSAKQFIPRGEV
jgi:hypothetical protein